MSSPSLLGDSAGSGEAEGEGEGAGDAEGDSVGPAVEGLAAACVPEGATVVGDASVDGPGIGLNDDADLTQPAMRTKHSSDDGNVRSILASNSTRATPTFPSLLRVRAVLWHRGERRYHSSCRSIARLTLIRVGSAPAQHDRSSSLSSASTRVSIGDLRPSPPGMPRPDVAPPVVAESGDPFTELRVIELIARLPRAVPIALKSIVDRLNATYLDWLFSERVVADAALQLAANWASDYRSTGGIVVDDGPAGATITVEDSTRVDPWIVRQAARIEAECHEVLLDFSRRERTTGAD